ncbi:MAG: hypothetical protein V5A27_05620 [Halapricum sp.]
MNRQRRAAVLWGVVGTLTFLVAIQGYELLTDRRVDLLVKFGVALLVGVVATVTTRLLEPRLSPDE